MVLRTKTKISAMSVLRFRKEMFFPFVPSKMAPPVKVPKFGKTLVGVVAVPPYETG